MVQGSPLFSARNVFELMQQKMTRRVPPREAIGQGISEALHGFIERALRIDPVERPSLSELLRWTAPCTPPPEELLVVRASGFSTDASTTSGGDVTSAETAWVTPEGVR
jgi:hypothetical protein